MSIFLAKTLKIRGLYVKQKWLLQCQRKNDDFTNSAATNAVSLHNST